MSTAVLTHAADLVENWRTGAEDIDNPAGPLYTGGRWAEYDLVMTNPPNSRCSACTASRTSHCC